MWSEDRTRKLTANEAGRKGPYDTAAVMIVFCACSEPDKGLKGSSGQGPVREPLTQNSRHQGDPGPAHHRRHRPGKPTASRSAGTTVAVTRLVRAAGASSVPRRRAPPQPQTLEPGSPEDRQPMTLQQLLEPRDAQLVWHHLSPTGSRSLGRLDAQGDLVSPARSNDSGSESRVGPPGDQ